MNGYAAAPIEVLDAAFATGKARARARPAGEPLPPDTVDHLSLPPRVRHGRTSLRRALDLNPNDADGLMQKGRLLAMRGRPEEALRCLEAAVRLNPLHPPWYNAHFGVALYSLRRFAEAAQALKQMPFPGSWSSRTAGGLLRPAGTDRRGTGSRGGDPAPAARFLDSRIHAHQRPARTRRRPGAAREGLIKAGLPE